MSTQQELEYTIKGLYILSNPVLEALHTIKIGMSMQLNKRIHDYDCFFSNNKYMYCYEMDVPKNIILIIESHILTITEHLSNTAYFASEYRQLNNNANITYYHELILRSLNECGITYIVHENPDFGKCDKIEHNNTENNSFENDYNNIVALNVKPNEQQEHAIDQCVEFYSDHGIGKIIWACGLGKALLGCMIVKKFNCHSVVIGVPSVYLQQQFIREIIRLFPNKRNILCVGSACDNYTANTTDKRVINKFIKSNTSECKFIVTTYDSCHLLVNKHTFDFKIGDEAHHLIGYVKNSGRTYTMFHNINAIKTLYMTATEKIIDSDSNNVYSMNDENIFGQLIDSKSVNWAITHGKITDYNVLILNNTENEISDIIKFLNIDVENVELLCSAYMTLKSMEEFNGLTHVLIYTNNITNSDKIIHYINVIMSSGLLKLSPINFYNKSLHSKCNLDLTNEIEEFTDAPLGIISCVYIFGEGFDLPKLNGVTFAETMTSDIRIVQSTLRANRLDRNNPNKIAYIIVPFIDTCEHTSFGKCIKIISKLRNVDETITQKIKVMKLSNEKCNNSNSRIYNHELICDPIELTNIKIKLIRSGALQSLTSPEQLEYNCIRQINITLKLQSREEYIKSKYTHTKYIIDPEKYFSGFGIWKNWYEFLGVNTKYFIQSKEEWIKFCKKKNVRTHDDYKKLCESHDNLPHEPCMFYTGFTNIQQELNLTFNRFTH